MQHLRSPEHARIAVFTNAYPKLSHSFIRNEIAALEQHGFDVTRISIRRTAETLLDADQDEARRTRVLLDGSIAPLLWSVARRACHSPRGFLRALRLTLAEPQRIAGRFRGLAYLAEACRLLDLLEAARVGHVHVHFGTNPTAVARLASKLGNIGYSFTAHGPDEFDAPVSIHLPAKIADARFVVAISDFGRSQLLRWARPADWHKVAVVRCGVADGFRTASPDAGGLDSRTLVCVARLDAQTGIPLLLQAAAMLAQLDDFSLRIIGDGALRPDLEAAIASLGLSRQVTLVGWLSPDGVRQKLMDARAMVLPSFADGLPDVLMEALALGRPVIATAIAGVSELVDAQTGWLVRAGSAEALADAMRAALRASPDTLVRLGEARHARVCRDHDLHHNAGQLAALLRDTLGSQNSQRDQADSPLRPMLVFRSSSRNPGWEDGPADLRTLQTED